MQKNNNQFTNKASSAHSLKGSKVLTEEKSGQKEILPLQQALERWETDGGLEAGGKTQTKPRKSCFKS